MAAPMGAESPRTPLYLSRWTAFRAAPFISKGASTSCRPTPVVSAARGVSAMQRSQRKAPSRPHPAHLRGSSRSRADVASWRMAVRVGMVGSS